MKRQFSWPTRTWNKIEVTNLLYMFCPQTEKYQEYMEEIETLYKNGLIQDSLYDAIHTMNDTNENKEFQSIEYKILRGTFQQRVSEPCSGFGQLLIQGRSRVQFMTLDNKKVIRVRPYGDVRVVDEIIALAIHLSLIVYDGTMDAVHLTQLGKYVIQTEHNNKIKKKSFDFWKTVMLCNPVVNHILEQVKYGYFKRDERYISLLEIGDNTGFYDGFYYNPETYIGHMYTCNRNIEYTVANMNTYIENVLSALENEELVISDKLLRIEQSKTGNSMSHLLTCYKITDSGMSALNKTHSNIMSLSLLFNGGSEKGDEERRGMLVSLLTLPLTKSAGGLSISNICAFFQKHIQVSELTILLDVFGLLRLGIPIIYRASSTGAWEKMTVFDIPKMQKLNMSSYKFYSPIEVVGTELNYSNMQAVSDMSRMKHELNSYLDKNYQYMPLIDFWMSAMKHNTRLAYEELQSFNQLLADMIYRNLNCSPYIFYNSKALQSPVASIIICYNKNELLIVDTSAVFINQYNDEMTSAVSIINSKPECSFHSAAKEYIHNMIEEYTQIEQDRTIARLQYNFDLVQIETFIVDSIQSIINGFNSDDFKRNEKETDEIEFLLEHCFKYLVLYHKDFTQIEDVYRNLFALSPRFRATDVSYMEWMQFVGKCISERTISFLEKEE